MNSDEMQIKIFLIVFFGIFAVIFAPKLIRFVLKPINEMRMEIKLNELSNRQWRICGDIVASHISELSIKKGQLTYDEGYGLINTEKWEKEKKKFIKKVVLPGFPGTLILDEKEISTKIDEEVTLFDDSKVIDDTKKVSLAGNPLDYERECARVLESNGWVAKVTSGSGDQGADIVATKDSLKVVIQCKKYTGSVGNKAVQEVHAASAFYGADRAVVVTNSIYTTSARQLAKSLDVVLLHNDELHCLYSILTS